MSRKNRFPFIPRNMSSKERELGQGISSFKVFIWQVKTARREGWFEVKWDWGCRELCWGVPWMLASLPAWPCGRNPSSAFLGRKLGTRDWELWRQLRRKHSQEKELEEGSGARDDRLSHQKLLLNKQQVSSINKACGMQMRFFLLLFCWLSSPKTPLRILIRNAKINKSPANPFLLLNKGKVNIANWTYFIRGCFVWAKKKNEKEKKKLFAFWQQVRVFAEFWFQIWWLGHYSWFAWNSGFLTSEVTIPRQAGNPGLGHVGPVLPSLQWANQSSSAAREIMILSS